jgi:hypothetical protein
MARTRLLKRTVASSCSASRGLDCIGSAGPNAGRCHELHFTLKQPEDNRRITSFLPHAGGDSLMLWKGVGAATVWPRCQCSWPSAPSAEQQPG